MRYKKRKPKTAEVQQNFVFWEKIAIQKASEDKALATMEKCLDSTDWLIVYVGKDLKCSICGKGIKNCNCPGGPNIRHDHEVLRVGDIRQNKGNALTDLAQFGGFPSGTIIAAKIRNKIDKGKIGFKWIMGSKIIQVKMPLLEGIVNWDDVTRVLEDRTDYQNRITQFTKNTSMEGE